MGVPGQVVTIDLLDRALADSAVVRRYRDKLVLLSDSECVWWTGAVSGRGHGRFWVGQAPGGRGHVMIAHRFGYALAYGAAALAAVEMLGHGCDNPLCQNAEHLEPMTALVNARDWASRRHARSSPLSDTRGALPRALAVRAAILAGDDPRAVLAAGDPDRGQDPLF